MRYQNGHIDDGSLLKCSSTKCPNCGSNQYRETVSRESCSACGLEFDYWGSGSNEVYDAYCKRLWAEQDAEREKRFNKEWGEDYA